MNTLMTMMIHRTNTANSSRLQNTPSRGKSYAKLGGHLHRHPRMCERNDGVGRGSLGEGDTEHLRSIYTPDVVQRMPGINQLSGEHKGVDNVIGLYGRLFELSGSTFAVDLKSVKTHGDRVVSVHHAKAQREGKALDADETIEFTFSGDKVSRLELTYADQAGEDAFWG